MGRHPILARFAIVPAAATLLAATLAGHAHRPATPAGQPPALSESARQRNGRVEGARTPWGDPDLQGIYNYATMTPLERPGELAAKAILTEAEAADYEGQILARQAVTNNTAGPDWWDPGT